MARTAKTAAVFIRSGTLSDVGFLREMLREAARVSAEERLAPEIARYVDGWGRLGDAAVVAVRGRERIGAAWYRLFGDADPGYGFVDAGTPELSIAVVPQLRGRGVGSALLAALLERAAEEGFDGLSLSVSPANPAVSLYLRHGFLRVPSRDEHWTMVCHLARD
jgi:GNAT superfamily N-acetyltransferase